MDLVEALTEGRDGLRVELRDSRGKKVLCTKAEVRVLELDESGSGGIGVELDVEAVCLFEDAIAQAKEAEAKSTLEALTRKAKLENNVRKRTPRDEVVARNRRIVAQRKQGLALRFIAEYHGLSISRITQILDGR